MCDHNSIEHLKLNYIQKSDNTEQYTCKICGSEIIKSLSDKKDKDFIQKYREKTKEIKEKEKEIRETIEMCNRFLSTQ